MSALPDSLDRPEGLPPRSGDPAPRANVVRLARPQRWDTPFDPGMTDEDVQMLRKRPEFVAIDERRFPPSVPLEGILRNDCRIVKLEPGDIVIREGDYGHSAFLLMRGRLRVVTRPGLPPEVLGRARIEPRSWLSALAQLWRASPVPEARDTAAYARSRIGLSHEGAGEGEERVSLLKNEAARSLLASPPESESPREVPPLAPPYQTVELTEGAIFGEIAALGRVPRTATVYAQTHATVLEIRWQGLNVIRRYDEGWRRIIDEGYRRNQLRIQLREDPILAPLGEEVLREIADRILFEAYGSFEWNVQFKRARRAGGDDDPDPIANEPVIAREGDYPDGLLILTGGFARVSARVGNGRRTLTYLRDGDRFGLEELYDAWKTGRPAALETTLTALGYVNLLRVPARVLEELVFPGIEPPARRLSDAARRPLSSDALLEWAVDRRFINATRAMLIDLERCVRCDDCVRACAAAHGGNPRFVRAGPVLGAAMVAHACMHCVDPVCMIGCPTGAIHRTVDQGLVVINDLACIGCGTCAASCPYENIRLVQIRDPGGRLVLDPDTETPILKATKCDFCVDQLTGPACVRACPWGALERVDFQNPDALAVASG